MKDLRQEMREYNLDVELEDADAEVVSEALTANMEAIALIERLREKLDAEADARRACKAAVVHTIGGLVEGLPTSEINYLQRLRELVGVEEQHKRCGNPVGSDLLHTALAQRDAAIRRHNAAEADAAVARDRMEAAIAAEQRVIGEREALRKERDAALAKLHPPRHVEPEFVIAPEETPARRDAIERNYAKALLELGAARKERDAAREIGRGEAWEVANEKFVPLQEERDALLVEVGTALGLLGSNGATLPERVRQRMADLSERTRERDSARGVIEDLRESLDRQEEEIATLTRERDEARAASKRYVEMTDKHVDGLIERAEKAEALLREIEPVIAREVLSSWIVVRERASALLAKIREVLRCA